MASDKPIEIVVCMGSSCFSRGNGANLAAIQSYIKEKQIDGVIRLAGSHCESECMHGPNISVNGRLIRGVSPSTVAEILDAVLTEAGDV